MTRSRKEISQPLVRGVAIWMILGMFVFCGARAVAQDGTTSKPWVVPDDARNVKNPLTATPENLTAGEQNFKDNCTLCHGPKGMGDGPGAKTLKVKPANFTDAKMMSEETDGSLFWKMSEGRGPMPSWRADFSETERWQLVLYLRKLAKDANKQDSN